MTQKSKSWKVLETVANHLKESNHQGSTNQRVESGEMSVLTNTDLLVSTGSHFKRLGATKTGYLHL